MVMRILNEPQPGYFKIKLVRGGPWVGACIAKINDHWLAFIDGKPVADCKDGAQTENENILRIWNYGRDLTLAQYRIMTRPGRDVTPDEPINLSQKASIF